MTGVIHTCSRTFSLGGGQRADDPRFASKARDAWIFCMSYSEKCPPSDLVRGVSVGGGVHLCEVLWNEF